MIFVNLDGDALSIIPDSNFVLLGVDSDPDDIHRRISLKVVSGVNQDLVYTKSFKSKSKSKIMSSSFDLVDYLPYILKRPGTQLISLYSILSVLES